MQKGVQLSSAVDSGEVFCHPVFLFFSGLSDGAQSFQCRAHQKESDRTHRCHMPFADLLVYAIADLSAALTA